MWVFILGNENNIHQNIEVKKNNAIILMSNLKINIRFFKWHFQVTTEWECSWTYNDYHKNLDHGWFDICEFKPFK